MRMFARIFITVVLLGIVYVNVWLMATRENLSYDLQILLFGFTAFCAMSLLYNLVGMIADTQTPRRRRRDDEDEGEDEGDLDAPSCELQRNGIPRPEDQRRI